jgi:hypothetical protein
MNVIDLNMLEHDVVRKPLRTFRHHALARYLEGWAEANPFKILSATTRTYRFHDPFVGTFAKWVFPDYFELLSRRLAGLGDIAPGDTAFRLHGPMTYEPGTGEFQFWREAPRLGLTGVAFLEVTDDGIAAERVAYDLGPASEQLRALPAR